MEGIAVMKKSLVLVVVFALVFPAHVVAGWNRAPGDAPSLDQALLAVELPIDPELLAEILSRHLEPPVDQELFYEISWILEDGKVDADEIERLAWVFEQAGGGPGLDPSQVDCDATPIVLLSELLLVVGCVYYSISPVSDCLGLALVYLQHLAIFLTECREPRNG